MLSRCDRAGLKYGLCCACWLAVKPWEALVPLLAGQQCIGGSSASADWLSSHRALCHACWQQFLLDANSQAF